VEFFGEPLGRTFGFLRVFPWFLRLVSQGVHVGYLGMETEPAFCVNDRVRERDRIQSPEVGTVLEVYKFEGRYRYIVRFDDGVSAVFFSDDLIAPGTRQEQP
jgi:hypothetical protein